MSYRLYSRGSTVKTLGNRGSVYTLWNVTYSLSIDDSFLFTVKMTIKLSEDSCFNLISFCFNHCGVAKIVMSLVLLIWYLERRRKKYCLRRSSMVWSRSRYISAFSLTSVDAIDLQLRYPHYFYRFYLGTMGRKYVANFLGQSLSSLYDAFLQ